MEIKNIYGAVIYTSPAETIKEAVVEAVARGADLTGAELTDAVLTDAYLTDSNLRGADGKKKKIITMRVLTGLYRYQVWAVLFEDGSRWVRMGCFFKSLEEWGDGIRKSNESEFPNDGSDKCEERVAAFEFAKAAVLRMKLEARP